MTGLRAAALAAAMLAAAPAAARTADYGRGEAEFRADAAALDVAAFADLPERGAIDIMIENPSALDHRLKMLGIYCSVWKVENPLSEMVERALGGLDRDGKLAPSDQRPFVRLRVDSVLSTMRCVEVEEMTTRCLTRTAIGGEARIEAEGKPPRTEPVRVEAEQLQSVGVCGGLARGTALSGRTASILLAERLEQLAAD